MLDRRMEELSGGERTKVSLARVLNSGANLLILDEPTNHLEVEAQEALKRALQMYRERSYSCRMTGVFSMHSRR
jgi:ATP-binding cassette subfamily F protein 3